MEFTLLIVLGMVNPNRLRYSIEERSGSIDISEENFLVWKELDEQNFNKLIESFGDEREHNKAILSGFLNSTNVNIGQLGTIKIDINHIKNSIRNKPDFPEDLEKKIAKLYLKKLYDSCVEDDALISELNSVFKIHSEKLENKLEKQKLKESINGLNPSQVTLFLKRNNITLEDLEDDEDDKNENIIEEIKTIIDNDKRNIDFKKIQIDVSKLGDTRNDRLNSVTLTNDKIFDLIPEINKICNFESQRLCAREPILSILEFELRDLIKQTKNLGQETTKDMKKVIKPTSTISEIFDKVKDPEIEKLMIQKGKLEELENLIISKDIYVEKKGLKQYIKGCEKAGIDDEVISKLKRLLLGTIYEERVRKFCYNEMQKTKKKIWEKYIENFERTGVDSEFISAIKKLVNNNFNFSQLSRNEQTILWQILIANNIDITGNRRTNLIDFNQEEFKKFIQDLYDFEKNDLTLTVDGVGDVNLKIKKEINTLPISSFSDVDNFKDMAITQPVRFTVNIDNNDQEIINDLESEGENGDNILRVNGLMETHMTGEGPINIGNGYELEICGKTITKKQLDDLLLCKDLPELNEKLKELGLYEALKDDVYNTRKEIFSPQNVYPNLDEDGFDMAPPENSGEISLSDKYSIFEEALKKIDVKVKKRNLIFDGNNIDTLSGLYILSKRGGDNYGKAQDKKVKNILGDYDRDGDEDGEEELGGREKGEEAATQYRNNVLKLNYQDYDHGEGNGHEDDSGDFNNYLIEGEAADEFQRHRNQLNEEGKEAFKNKLYDLCDNDDDIEDKEDLKNGIDIFIENLNNPSSDTNTDTDTTDADNTENPEAGETGEEVNEEKEFRDYWNSLNGDSDCNFREIEVENANGTKEKKETTGFEVGTRLYFDLGESQLPPIDEDIKDTKKSYYCFQIVNVGDDKFTLKAIGGDIKSNLVGKEYEFQRTKADLESLTKNSGVYKVRKEEKGKEREWGSCLESINKAGFFSKFTVFGELGGVDFDGKKFVNKNGEEIKYFDRVEGCFDDSKPDIKEQGQGSKLYKYEIKKIDTTKGTVKIASSFDSYDKNYKAVKYDYENELPFEQFILLMEGKRLKGYTQAQQEEMETEYRINDPKRLATKGRRSWISIGSIINVFNSTTKAIKGKLEEKRKEQDADLENYLFSQEGLNLYGKSRRLLGDVAEKLQYEFYINRENRTWKKIEERYKIFEADPKYTEFFAEHLQKILEKKGYVGNDKDRYKFAAAFLIMVKKEGPYPRVFADQKDKGKRVENLLGSEHKTRFLNFYEKKKYELEQEKDLGHQSGARLALQEELNKMEIQYIISAIDGRAPYGPGTISNELMLKSIWSQTFMQKLEENINGYYNNHQAEKDKLLTFYAAEESYLRNIGSGKFQAALPALERMCETAKTPGEVYRIKGYMLGAMLMGIIKNNSTANTIKSFWGTCRSMGFTPGFRMRDVEHPYKVKVLLDGVTNGSFSKDTKFNVSDFEPGKIKDGKYNFGKKFQSYWNSHGSDILEKIENPTYKNKDIKGDKSIIDLANEKDNPNNYIFKDIIKNSTTNEIDSTNDKVPPMFAQNSPLSATSNVVKLYIPENGKYSKLRNEEDISSAEDFWGAAEKAIPTDGNADQDTVDFIFKKFFNRFDTKINTNDQTAIVRSIKLIQKEKDVGHTDNANYMLWYMFKGKIHETTRGAFPKPEFENVMNKFVKFFYNNVEKINESTIKSTFDDDSVIDFNNPYIMLNWKQFRSFAMQTMPGGSSKSKYNRLVRVALRGKQKETTDVINYEISDIWNKTRHYSIPDSKPSDSMGEDYGIRVDMNMKDADLRAEENKYT